MAEWKPKWRECLHCSGTGKCRHSMGASCNECLSEYKRKRGIPYSEFLPLSTVVECKFCKGSGKILF